MPRTQVPFATERMTLRVSASQMQRLNEMQAETEADSINQVIRQAISVYDFALQVRKKKGRLAVLDEDDVIVKEVELLP